MAPSIMELVRRLDAVHTPCRVGIHKYVYTTRESPYYAKGEKKSRFRVCERCGKVQEYITDYYGNRVWYNRPSL
jgi:hypothetical protein